VVIKKINIARDLWSAAIKFDYAQGCQNAKADTENNKQFSFQLKHDLSDLNIIRILYFQHSISVG